MSDTSNPHDSMALHDHDLVQRAKRGDMTAFEQLVYRYDKQVLSIAARYVNSAEDAKDIYQEVFMRVFRGMSKFQLRSEFSTWLFRITTNVCLSHRSRRRRHSHLSLDCTLDSEDDLPHRLRDNLADKGSSEQPTLDSEISTLVQHALSSLSPRQRMVFSLKHDQGYKLREIAEMMDCTEGTVKKYLFAATQRVRKELKGVFD